MENRSVCRSPLQKLLCDKGMDLADEMEGFVNNLRKRLENDLQNNQLFDGSDSEVAEEYISKHIVLDSWFDVLNKLRYILNKSTIPNGSLTEDEAISLDQASTIQTENMYNSLTHNLNATETGDNGSVIAGFHSDDNCADQLMLPGVNCGTKHVIPGKTRSCYSSIRKQSDTEWDDDDIDFTCADNENDPLEKLLGFKPEIDARICKFFNSSGGCKAKDKCAFRHVSYGNCVSKMVEEIFDTIPGFRMNIGGFYPVKISSVQGALVSLHVLQRLPLTQKSLIEFTKIRELQSHEYSMAKTFREDVLGPMKTLSPENNKVDPSLGSLVAVKENLNGVLNFWRGRILKPMMKDHWCVSLLDQGTVVSVRRSHIFRLRKQYTMYPALAQDATISSKMPRLEVEQLQQSFDVSKEGQILQPCYVAQVVDVTNGEPEVIVHNLTSVEKLLVAQATHFEPNY